MTRRELAALRAAATPGPWVAQGPTLIHGPDQGGMSIGPLLAEVFSDEPHNARFIAAAANFDWAADIDEEALARALQGVPLSTMGQFVTLDAGDAEAALRLCERLRAAASPEGDKR